MKKMIGFLLVLGVCLEPSLAFSEEGRTLKDRIKSVSNRMHGKSGRLELFVMPLTSLSLNDAFYNKYGAGLGLGYHFSEAFSLQAFGLFHLNVSSSHATYYGSNPDTTLPYAGKRDILFGADFCWAPVYGKISLAAEYIMHFDTYFMLGAGGLRGLHAEDNSRFNFTGSFGMGIRVFLKEWLALKLEIKDYLVFDKVTFQAGSGIVNEEQDIQHQLVFNIALSFFFLRGDQED